MALRIAFFYACGMFSGTISGLLAYAISFMNGLAGLAGWRWMFILYVAACIALTSSRCLKSQTVNSPTAKVSPPYFAASTTYFFLPNYPNSCKFFSEDEKRAIIANLPATQPTSTAKTWDWSQAKTLFKDPTFFTFTLLWICHAIGGWGVSTVLPTVIYELGMTGTAVAQLMTMVGSYALA
jgi:hypothetical protein